MKYSKSLEDQRFSRLFCEPSGTLSRDNLDLKVKYFSLIFKQKSDCLDVKCTIYFYVFCIYFEHAFYLTNKYS